MEIGQAKNIAKGVTPAKVVHLGQTLVWPNTKGIYIPFDKLPIANEGYTDGEPVNITLQENAQLSLETINNIVWTKVKGTGSQGLNSIKIESPYIGNVCNKNWVLELDVNFALLQQTVTVFSLNHTIYKGNNVSEGEIILHSNASTYGSYPYMNFTFRDFVLLSGYSNSNEYAPFHIKIIGRPNDSKIDIIMDNQSTGRSFNITIMCALSGGIEQFYDITLGNTYTDLYFKDLKFYLL